MASRSPVPSGRGKTGFLRGASQARLGQRGRGAVHSKALLGSQEGEEEGREVNHISLEKAADKIIESEKDQDEQVETQTEVASQTLEAQECLSKEVDSSVEVAIKERTDVIQDDAHVSAAHPNIEEETTEDDKISRFFHPKISRFFSGTVF